MHLIEEIEIHAPQLAVWEAIHDPDVLRTCLPGCKRLIGSAEEGFEASITLRLGPLRKTLSGPLKFRNPYYPESVRIGGLPFGAMDVQLTKTDDGTLVELEIGGDPGELGKTLGSGMIESVARKVMGDFLAALKDNLESRPDAVNTAQ